MGIYGSSITFMVAVADAEFGVIKLNVCVLMLEELDFSGSSKVFHFSPLV